jgi:hypothetical protein
MEDFTLPNVGARLKKPEWKLSKGFSQTSFFLLPTFLGWCGQLMLVGSSTCLPYPNFFLPTFLGWCGQLMLVGSSTCLPYPNFFQNFHFPKTFDP